MTCTTPARVLMLVSMLVSSRLLAQPSTDKLPDARGKIAKFGVELGGSSGPFSLFDQSNAKYGNRVEQAMVLSYAIRPRDRYPVRAVLWLNRGEHIRRYQTGGPYESTITNTDQSVSIGALVDMFDKPFKTIRFIGTLGGGVIPYASSRYTITDNYNSTTPLNERSSGTGAQLAGSFGIRWKRFTIDQTLQVRAGRPGDNDVIAPITMGVRF